MYLVESFVVVYIIEFSIFCTLSFPLFQLDALESYYVRRFLADKYK
jgi:hypothetical protein